MLIKTDIAMYKAKELGKNQLIYYHKDLEEEKNLIFNIEKDLKKQLKRRK